jgi:hypothetical protein
MLKRAMAVLTTMYGWMFLDLRSGKCGYLEIVTVRGYLMGSDFLALIRTC